MNNKTRKALENDFRLFLLTKIGTEYVYIKNEEAFINKIEEWSMIISVLFVDNGTYLNCDAAYQLGHEKIQKYLNSTSNFCINDEIILHSIGRRFSQGFFGSKKFNIASSADFETLASVLLKKIDEIAKPFWIKMMSLEKIYSDLINTNRVLDYTGGVVKQSYLLVILSALLKKNDFEETAKRCKKSIEKEKIDILNEDFDRLVLNLKENELMNC